MFSEEELIEDDDEENDSDKEEVLYITRFSVMALTNTLLCTLSLYVF